MAEAYHSIHLAEKRRMQRFVVLLVLLMTLVYVALLMPQPLLEHISGLLVARWGFLAKLLSDAAGAAALSSVLLFVLFGSDSAFNGRNPTARCVRTWYASESVRKRYECSEGEAAALWFRYFDTWAFDDSPNRLMMDQTYHATYTARGVFYLTRALLLLSVLGAASMLFSDLSGLYDGEAWRRAIIDAFILLCFVGAHVLLQLTNRIPKGLHAASGCWARVQNVFARSGALLTQDVLRHAENLDAAFDRVSSLRASFIATAEEKAKGSQPATKLK